MNKERKKRLQKMDRNDLKNVFSLLNFYNPLLIDTALCTTMYIANGGGS